MDAYSAAFLEGYASAAQAPAERIVKHACGVVGCMLTQGKLPEAAPNLVATLAHLHDMQAG